MTISVVPKTIFNIENFSKLCKWINDNDNELINIGEDINHLKDQSKLTEDQGEQLKELSERYVQFDRCYQIAQDFSAWEISIKKEDKWKDY